LIDEIKKEEKEKERAKATFHSHAHIKEKYVNSAIIIYHFVKCNIKIYF
jgi:hypothetical protein